MNKVVGMNDNVKKWVAALRSGDYKQTKRLLRDHTGFCCLGVACDISGHGTWIKKLGQEGNPSYASGGQTESTCLTESVMESLELKTKIGIFKEPIHTPKGDIKSLVGLNDLGFSFDEIATYIEKYFDRLI